MPKPTITRNISVHSVVAAIMTPGDARRAMRRLLRRVAQRTMILAADQYNYFLVKGIHNPADRFDHRRFMEQTRWWVSVNMVRNATLELLSREIYVGNVQGATAELGVAEGYFAALINRAFSDRGIYLFDTFYGLDERDVRDSLDRGFGGKPFRAAAHSVQEVVDNLPFPNRAIIRPGWFPESAAGCEDQRFCFVSIDVGLYAATYAGLQWFYPRLETGGYIIVADYNGGHAPGVKAAVRQFTHEFGVAFAALPDVGGSAVLAKPVDAGLSQS